MTNNQIWVANVEGAIDDAMSKRAEVTWQQIVTAIDTRSIKVADWGEVRKVLQSFINDGMLARDKRRRPETYRVLPLQSHRLVKEAVRNWHDDVSQGES